MGRTVLVGRVRRAHGIRGEVMVDRYGDAPGILDPGSELALRRQEAVVTVTVEKVRPTPRGWIVAFQGLRDRNEAEALAGVQREHEQLSLRDPHAERDSTREQEVDLGRRVALVEEAPIPLGQHPAVEAARHPQEIDVLARPRHPHMVVGGPFPQEGKIEGRTVEGHPSPAGMAEAMPVPAAPTAVALPVAA